KIDLNELSERVTRRLAPNVFRQGGEIAFQASDKKVWVEGDAVLISEAMDNLIDNAARYGAADERLEINIGVVQQDDMAVFFVQDNGAGVVQEDRERIFERFQRGQEDGSDGCGLGLPIVREIAELHGGSVRLAETAVGARFELVFPMALQFSSPENQRIMPIAGTAQARPAKA
ncbi:MAG: sensor histidine kinase, partial [Hyphomicrobiales bacterium]